MLVVAHVGTGQGRSFVRQPAVHFHGVVVELLGLQRGLEGGGPGLGGGAHGGVGLFELLAEGFDL